jgi:hypothetical protein
MTKTITTCDICGSAMPISTVSLNSGAIKGASIMTLNFSISDIEPVGKTKKVSHVSVSVDGGSELDICNKCILGKMGIAINTTSPIAKP